MPAVSTGRENSAAQPKRKVKRKPVAGPPAPKKPTVVAPADRVSERVDARKVQLKKSVRKAGDAPQDRATDQKRAEASVKKQYDAERGKVTRVAGGKVIAYKPGTTVPPDVAHAVAARKATAVHKAETAAKVAPVLKVLDQTTRPLHAIAAGSDAALTGRNVPKALKAGIQNKDKTTFSTVLKHAGVKNKTVAGIGGFVLDVGLDPTTYLTGGTGSIAAKSAAKAGEKAEKAVAKAAEKAPKTQRVVTAKEERRAAERSQGGGGGAPTLPERARVRAERTGDQTKGATVKVAGKELPGVRKATAKASKPVRAAGRRVVPQKVRDAVRSVGADVNPDITPAGVSRETSQKAAQATRTARSKTNRGLHDAQQQALGIKQQVGEANYSRIIDAIEAGKIKSLPPELRDVAVRVRSQFKHANRLRKQAGIRGGEIKKRTVKVPPVTADVTAAQERLAAAVQHRGTIARKPKRLTRVPSREEFIAKAPKASRDSPDVTVDRLTENIKPNRKAGYAIESEHVKQIDRVTKKVVGHGRELPGSKVIVRRDLHGRVMGALHITLDEHGKPDILEIAVDPTHRGKGVASRLYRYAQRQGYDVEAASGRGGYTTAGAALAHKRLSARAGQQDKVSAKALRAARGETSRAQAELDTTLKLKREQQLAARKARKKKALQDEGKLPQGYIPHRLTDEAAAEGEKRAGGVGRRVIRPSSSKARSEQRSLKALRKEEPGKYSEDLPNLYAGRKAEGATAVARAELNRRIADLGKDVRKGKDVTLNKGESVYHIVGSDMRKVDAKEVAGVIDQGGKKGRYVVLHDDIVKRAIEGSQPTLQGPGIVRGLDKAQAGFKRIALATPGFHLRNLVGDTQNAYLGQSGHRLPKNMLDAGRVLKAEGRRDKSLRKLEPGKTGGKTLKTGRYGNITYDQAAEQLGKHGAMRTGYTGRELPELAASGSAGKVKVGGVRLPRRAKQALLNREDLPRLTTAIEALKKGATWEEAAQKVADYHFDYGHLTQFERQFARRAAPFYTFSARNIPLQTKSLITKPGKFANYEKLREEAAKASGMDEESKKARALTDQLKQAGVKLPAGWEANLTEWESRNAGVPVSWQGHKFTVSMGMPLVDLNEFPGAALGDQFSEYYQKGMSLTTPVVKNAIEFMENHSFFFRDELERQNAPLVAAPEWVRMLPSGLKKKMGVTENYIDKKTGKKTLGYRAKADYVVKSVPGTPAFLNKMATQGHDRVGKGPLGKALAFAGVKATPYDPVATAVNVAYARRTEVEKRMAALRQTGVSMQAPTPEYAKLNDQLKILTRIAYEGRASQGYKVLPTQGGPKKAKASSAGRVKVPGVTGRVKVPGAGGRVKVP